jgi:hypothetical protein
MLKPSYFKFKEMMRDAHTKHILQAPDALLIKSIHYCNLKNSCLYRVMGINPSLANELTEPMRHVLQSLL